MNDNLDIPEMYLSPIGIIVDNEIKKFIWIYENIKIDKYIIMPNHIHMILITDNKGEGTSRAPSRTNEIVPSFVSMLKRFTNKKAETSIWHRSYHDHVIRNEKDYERIWKYIDTNPIEWEWDCYYKKE